MITFLRGKLADITPAKVTLDVHGVGYEVLIPLSSFDRLGEPGTEITLLTHFHVREDAHILYGFMTEAERGLFRLVTHSVSGVGPRIALNILSGLGVSAFRSAVATGDVKALSQVSGVGKKTAERIVVELKDKVGESGTLVPGMDTGRLTAADQKLNDAALALTALGYKPLDAQKAVKEVMAVRGSELAVDELVRFCLKGGRT